MQLYRLGNDAAPVFLEIGGFAEGGQLAGGGVVRGDDDRGRSCREDWWWRILRDYHGLEYSLAGSGVLLDWIADVWRRAGGLGRRCCRRGDRQAGASARDARRTVLRDECGKKMTITLVLSGRCISGIHRSGGSDGDCICGRSGPVGLAQCSDRLLVLVPYTVTGK